MPSEIYKSCQNGDIDLLKALIETSSSELDLNKVETNGNTPLHVACSHDHINIVKLLLYKYKVYPYIMNDNGLTAYQVASNDKIRQLFHEPEKDKYRFSTDANFPNPFELINNGSSSKSHWLDHYPRSAPISTELFNDVLNHQSDGLFAVINFVKYLFGIDPDKKKIEQWSALIQSMIDKTFTSPDESSDACKLLQNFTRTWNIEYLLKLYTLNKSFCQYLGEDLRNTNCFCAPIYSYLYTVGHRAYQGRCYRGLTMNKKNSDEYKHAFNHEESFIKTKTLCSTSIKQSVAQFFADSGNLQDEKIKVQLIFDFDESCSTAIILFARGSDLESITNFDNEQEVLILPGTIFSVTFIEPNDETQLQKIYLQHYNTDEEKADMHRDRLQSFIDSCILD